MKTIPSVFLFALLLVSCTALAAPAPAPRTAATFAAPREKVWPLIVAEVGLEYPVQAIDKESGLLTTSFVNIPAGYGNRNMKQWVIDPGGFLSTWNGLRMNLKILAVETEPGKTLVKIACHYEAFESNVKKTWVVAQSNGSLESAILARIEKQIAPPKAP